MSGSLSALFLQNPELANAIRKREQGAALMQQGMDSSPVRHWAQGLSRLAAALVGGYEQGQADKEIKAYGEKSDAEMGDFLKRALSGGGAPAQPPAMPEPAPAAATPSLAPIPAHLDDNDLTVRTVWGEGRGETPLGQQAVAAVIRNRARAAGQSVRDVVLAPNQFEPWNNPDTRARMLALDPNSEEYKRIAQAVVGTENDPTGGATHFYSPRAQAALGRPAPAWATGQGMDIGNHRFYNLPYSPSRGAPIPAGGDAIPVSAPALPPDAQPVAAPAAAGMPQGVDYRALALEAVNSRNPRLQAMAPLLMQMAKGEDQTANLAPGGQLIDKRTGRVIATNTTVNPTVALTNDMRGESTWEAARAKDFAERVKGWEDAGTKSTQTLSRLTRMEAMLDNFTTGAGSQTSITAGQLAQRLGIPQATMEGLGIDPKTIAQGEGIRSLASQMLVGMIGSGGFPAQGFSNADREMLERALPSLANSPAGNRMIIQIMRAGAQRDLEIGQAWRAWSRTKGDSLSSVRDFQAERLPQITEKDIVAPILEQGGWQDATPMGQGGAQPQPGSVLEGATATNPQTGQRVIFRGGRWEPAQ